MEETIRCLEGRNLTLEGEVAKLGTVITGLEQERATVGSVRLLNLLKP